MIKYPATGAIWTIWKEISICYSPRTTSSVRRTSIDIFGGPTPLSLKFFCCQIPRQIEIAHLLTAFLQGSHPHHNTTFPPSLPWTPLHVNVGLYVISAVFFSAQPMPGLQKKRHDIINKPFILALNTTLCAASSSQDIHIL
jgi:hypothetical protein